MGFLPKPLARRLINQAGFSFDAADVPPALLSDTVFTTRLLLTGRDPPLSCTFHTPASANSAPLVVAGFTTSETWTHPIPNSETQSPSKTRSVFPTFSWIIPFSRRYSW